MWPEEVTEEGTAVRFSQLISKKIHRELVGSVPELSRLKFEFRYVLFLYDTLFLDLLRNMEEGFSVLRDFERDFRKV